jgi:chromosome segregation ATPase
MDAQMSRIGDWSNQTDGLEERVARLDQLVAQTGARLEVVARVGEEFRTSFQALLAQADELARKQAGFEKLESQLSNVARLEAAFEGVLARQAEIDALEIAFEGITTKVGEAERRMEALASSREVLSSVETRLSALTKHLDTANDEVARLKLDETLLSTQASRLIQFADTSRTLADEAARRVQALHALTEELSRSGALSGLAADMAAMRARQDDAVAQAAALTSKLEEFAQRSDDIDQRVRALGDRGLKVSAVESEIDAVERMLATSELDSRVVGERQQEVTALRRQMHDLMAMVDATKERIAADAARSKDTLARLMAEARASLATASEQRAMVDRLNGRLAGVQFVVEEAQNTLRMLNQERELVERIEQSLRELGTRIKEG